jgi:predicted metal-dependent enzyme (double-stranded beta helix superfamily)
MSSVGLARSIRPQPNLARLRGFVRGFAEVVAGGRAESAVLREGRELLLALIAHDDWLPDEYAAPSPERYQQYLLHCDSRERFSVVSFVWGPGQATPVHDHRVWGLVGVLRGAELSQSYARSPADELAPSGSPELLDKGRVVSLSPSSGDVHRVANAHDDRTSISIHVYGGNIGAVERATYDAEGRPKPFVSGYANRAMPNLWEKSAP